MRAIHWIIFVLQLILIVNTQNICDTCDCTIGEESSDFRAVRSVKSVCNDGTFRWYNLYKGALRIYFKPRFRGAFKLCFILQVENARVQVSEEISEKSSSTALSRPPTLKPVVSTDNEAAETCLLSASDSIHLFFETERTVRSRGFALINIKFVMEKTNDALIFNPKEECRPCTDRELILAYCSHEVVIVGSMSNVTHLNDKSRTDININISKVVRQHTFLYEPKRDPYLTETMSRHRRCNVGYGPGLFLFTGKWRLGQLKMTCSPYYKDWISVLKRAIYTGQMECEAV